jgi:hypothetical protein
VDRFPFLVRWSLLVAILGFCGPWVFRREGLDLAVRASLWFAAAWGILVAAALVRDRKRGLWALIGAPLAVYWPLAMAALDWACAHNVSACP